MKEEDFHSLFQSWALMNIHYFLTNENLVAFLIQDPNKVNLLELLHIKAIHYFESAVLHLEYSNHYCRNPDHNSSLCFTS